MFKNKNKIEKGFAKTAVGMSTNPIQETKFGFEDDILLSANIPSPPGNPPHPQMKTILTEEDKEAFKQKLKERTQINIKYEVELKQKKYNELKQKVIDIIKNYYDMIDKCIENKLFKTNYYLISPKTDGLYSKYDKMKDILKIIEEFNESNVLPLNVSYIHTNDLEKHNIYDYKYNNCYGYFIYFDWS